MQARNVRLFLFNLGVFFLWSSMAWAQTTFGHIVGNVTDSSGAIIPEATVTLTSLETNIQQTVKTNNSGFYQFLNLLPASYRVEVEFSGFKRFAREPIVVEVEATVRIDIAMEVGAVTESVEVTTATPLLETVTSSLGEVVQRRKVEDLPLNGRNPLALLALVPGVVPGGGADRNASLTNNFAFGNFFIGGAMPNQTEFMFDGVPMSGRFLNGVSFVPQQESIQEFKVQTNNLSSEFGRTAGAITNLTSKSGSNEFHGSVYEFLRNEVLDAGSFFDNQAGAEVSPLKQNQFGAAFGGPIVRNKTFFFTNYEGYRRREGVSSTLGLLTVPTAAQRTGDFSETRDSNGKLITIYDPLTTCGRLENPACAVDAAGNKIITRQPFMDNAIPMNRLDPTAAAIAQQLWSPANLPGEPFTNINNFITPATLASNVDQFTARVDHHINDRHSILGRYSYWRTDRGEIDSFGTGTTPVDFGAPEDQHVTHFVFGDNYSFSPTTLLDFRFGYNGYSFTRLPPGGVVNDITQFGFSESHDSQKDFGHGPIVQIEGITSPNIATGSNIQEDGDIFSVRPGLTKIRGRHTLKFGGEVRLNRLRYIAAQSGSGQFDFNRQFTALNPLNPEGTGFGFASFLLGMGSGGFAQAYKVLHSQRLYRAFYIQDNFRVTNKLTLNLGLRYSQDGGLTERDDSLTEFLPGATHPLSQQVEPQLGRPLLGRYGLVNSQDRPSRHLRDTYMRQWGPRLGFAYRVTDKTVLRGGYGIFWIPANLSHTDGSTDVVNAATTPFVGTIDGSLTPVDLLRDPFPNGIKKPPGRDPGIMDLTGGGFLFANTSEANSAYAQTWNFNIQRELPGDILVDVAYAGNKGTRIPLRSITLNHISDSTRKLGSALFDQVPNPFFGLITDGTLAGPTVAQGQLMTSYPQFDQLELGWVYAGSSIYHSMQMKVEKRFKGGSSILVAYTISKTLADTDTTTDWLDPGGSPGFIAQDPNNRRAERSVTAFDVPQRLVASYTLDLPFGRDQRFASNVSGVAGKVISGWAINGVYTLQSGFPMGMSASTNALGGFAPGCCRPNRTDQSAKITGGRAQDRLGQWFNTSAFTDPNPFEFGNTTRALSDVRSHGINNLDFSLFKNTYFGPDDRLNLQFRAEFFNMFNRVRFGFPGRSLGDASFGVVSSQINSPRIAQLALKLIF